MIRIAHRGFWWPDPTRQNTPGAIRAALQRGWAVEFDIHSEADDLYVKHDKEAPGVALPAFADIFDALPLGDEARLFWNPKDADALMELGRVFDEHPTWRARSLIVDAELVSSAVDDVPGMRLLVRAGDRDGESVERAIDAPWAAGLWLDSPTLGWFWRVGPEVTRPVYLVSPELHGYPLDLKAIEAFGNVAGICTDVPHLFQAIRDNAACAPQDKWWGE